MAAANGQTSAAHVCGPTSRSRSSGGHSCANVPNAGVGSCDHVEEVLLPEDTLGKDYLVTPGIFANQQTLVPSLVRVAAIQTAPR